MQDKTLLGDPSIQRLVNEFDSLADRLHTLMERDPPRRRNPETLRGAQWEFTTEWQMVSGVKEGRAD
jgi:hypothetical protein